MLTASCHCGSVTLRLARKPRVLTQCTCSICRRYAALWAYCTPRTARVTCRPDGAAAYAWNDRLIEFYHCRACGCVTHYESATNAADRRIAVNARMLAPADIAGIRVRTFDGADTWKYLD